MRRTAHRLALGAVLPLIALGPSACGDDEKQVYDKVASADDPGAGAQPSEEPPEEAADPVVEEEADQPSVDAKAFARRMMRGYDHATTARVSMQINGPSVTTATGVVDYTAKPPSSRIVMTMPGVGDVEVITVGGLQYVKVPGQGDVYLKGDPSASGMADVSGLDTTQTMRQVSEGITEVTEEGAERVGGVATTHYAVTIDTAKVDLPQFATGGLPAVLLYDVWLDAQDRTVRFRMDLGSAGSTSMEMSDFGTPVTIKAPPAEKVRTAPAA